MEVVVINRTTLPWILACCLVLLSCSAPPGLEADETPADKAPPEARVEAAADTPPESEADEGPLTLDAYPADTKIGLPFSGDLDEMAERNVIRALVSYSKTMYFLDGGQQRGTSYEGLKEFEKFVNRKFGRKTLKLHVVLIPVPREQIFPALEAGLGDLAVANLTITPNRLETADFSDPVARDVSEIVITGAGQPRPVELSDLSGRQVHVRRSSSYWDSLVDLSVNLMSQGLAPVDVVAAEDFLEDEDLLEMVDAGVIPATVVDSHKADLWQQVFPNMTVHSHLALREGGEIAWAIRKGCPQLRDLTNEFVKKHRQGTLFGNILINRYFKSTKWISNPAATRDRRRFDEVVELFRRYGERYDFDYLLLTALAFQESRLDHNTRSSVGAVGIMQVLPSTAADKNVGIPNVEDLEANIHAGTKYLDFVRRRYFSGDEISGLDRMLFALASYNAGPAKINRLRSEAEKSGLDPNRWFGNVEVVAARRIGRETVQYVSNIAKYYVVYRQMTSTPRPER